MDRVKTVMAALFATTVLCAWPARAQEAATDFDGLDRWEPLVTEAAERFHIPARWIRDVMRVESGGRTELDGQPITSSKGAMGLMQVMPETYAEMRRAHDLGADPHMARDNILAGAAYLKAMHDRFGWPGLFAAYNAGPARYDDYLRTGRALPSETIAYLAAIDSGVEKPVFISQTASHNAVSRAPSTAESVSGRSIFFVQNGVRIMPDSSARTASTNRHAAPIFVPLSGQRP